MSKEGKNWNKMEIGAVAERQGCKEAAYACTETGNDRESAYIGKGGEASNLPDGNREKWRKKSERTVKNIIYRRIF